VKEHVCPVSSSILELYFVLVKYLCNLIHNLRQLVRIVRAVLVGSYFGPNIECV
jgi:hypothetical protein